MSKTDLRARPIVARTHAIETHLTVVFTALAVSREIQDGTGLSLRRVIHALRPLRSATAAIHDLVHALEPRLDPEEQAIVEALRSRCAKHQAMCPNSGQAVTGPSGGFNR